MELNLESQRWITRTSNHFLLYDHKWRIKRHFYFSSLYTLYGPYYGPCLIPEKLPVIKSNKKVVDTMELLLKVQMKKRLDYRREGTFLRRLWRTPETLNHSKHTGMYWTRRGRGWGTVGRERMKVLWDTMSTPRWSRRERRMRSRRKRPLNRGISCKWEVGELTKIK